MSDEGQTGNMWANMLGLGPLFATINDPGFQQQIRQIVESITATAEAVRRLEIKIDLIMQAQALEYDVQFPRVTDIPAQLGAAGIGGATVTGGAPDNGIGHGAASGEGVTERLDDHSRPHRVGGGIR